MPATATMADIRSGFTTALASLAANWSLQDYPTSMSVPPFITVVGANIDFDAAMGRGADFMFWTILACRPATSDIGQQQLLEALVDPTSATSIKTLLEADKTLGGVISWCRVVSVSKPSLYTSPGQPESIGVEFNVQVMT